MTKSKIIIGQVGRAIGYNFDKNSLTHLTICNSNLNQFYLHDDTSIWSIFLLIVDVLNFSLNDSSIRT